MYIEITAHEYRQARERELQQARLVKLARQGQRSKPAYARALVWLGKCFIRLGESLQRPFSTPANAPYVCMQELAQ